MWVIVSGGTGTSGMRLAPSDETTRAAALSIPGGRVRPRSLSGARARKAEAATSTATATPRSSSIPAGSRFRDDRGAGPLRLLTTEGDGVVCQRPEGVCVMTRDHGQPSILHEPS